MRSDWRAEAGGLRRGAPPAVGGRRRGGRGVRRRKMAAAAVAAVRAWFWNERFWLPHNVTWADLAGEPDGGLQYPRASHVLSAFPLALGIFAVRLLFERWARGRAPSRSSAALRRRPLPPPRCSAVRCGAVRARRGLLATCGGAAAGAGRAVLGPARFGAPSVRLGAVPLGSTRLWVPFSPECRPQASFHLST